MFTDDRTRMRRTFAEAWRKHQGREPLTPLEAAIADLVLEHPEYHRILEGPQEQLDRDYLPEQGETNPFLHLAMHLGLREQVATDRPPGIRALHGRLAGRLGDVHEAEHRMLECLAGSLWEAQRNGQAPDEAAYLECLKRLVAHRGA